MSDAQNPLKRAGEAPTEQLPESKKSKAAEQPTAGGSMDIEEDDGDDDLAEIDPSNIISGPRTRGKKIDFTKIPEDAQLDGDDDDDGDAIIGDETMDGEDEEAESDEEEEEEGEPVPGS